MHTPQTPHNFFHSQLLLNFMEDGKSIWEVCLLLMLLGVIALVKYLENKEKIGSITFQSILILILIIIAYNSYIGIAVLTSSICKFLFFLEIRKQCSNLVPQAPHHNCNSFHVEKIEDCIGDGVSFTVLLQKLLPLNLCLHSHFVLKCDLLIISQ